MSIPSPSPDTVGVRVPVPGRRSPRGCTRVAGEVWNRGPLDLGTLSTRFRSPRASDYRVHPVSRRARTSVVRHESPTTRPPPTDVSSGSPSFFGGPRVCLDTLTEGWEVPVFLGWTELPGCLVRDGRGSCSVPVQVGPVHKEALSLPCWSFGVRGPSLEVPVGPRSDRVVTTSGTREVSAVRRVHLAPRS